MPDLDIPRITRALLDNQYIADSKTATSLYLSICLKKPLLIEGPAGVGKTEIAKILAQINDTDLIRLQCYQGLDSHTALYEWNYQRQLLQIKLLEQQQQTIEEKQQQIFNEDFLLKRPLLQAITHHRSPVLLIDEIDRADEEFESFLLEILSDWQITIPELHTIKATHIPYVIITSNRVRPLSEAIRRRCLYLWMEYPDFAKELQIIRCKIPNIDESLARDLCAFIQLMRKHQWEKKPGVVETLDWAATLSLLHCTKLSPEIVEDVLGVLLKEQRDIIMMRNVVLQKLFLSLEKLHSRGLWTSEDLEEILREHSSDE